MTTRASAAGWLLALIVAGSASVTHPLDILAMPDDDGGPPQFLIPPGADLERLRGGPEVTFEGLMPKAGRYRAFTQFRRHDRLHTFAFTFYAIARTE